MLKKIIDWLKNRTVIAPVTAGLSFVAGALTGAEVDPATQAVVVDQTVAAVSAVGTLVGTIWTIWQQIAAARAARKAAG